MKLKATRRTFFRLAVCAALLVGFTLDVVFAFGALDILGELVR